MITITVIRNRQHNVIHAYITHTSLLRSNYNQGFSYENDILSFYLKNP